MRRNISRRRATLARIKDQQDVTAAAENHSQVTALDYLQSHRITIEPLRSTQILCYKTVSKILAGRIAGILHDAPKENKVSCRERARAWLLVKGF